ncbi:16S rRNA (cytidine(1402)-2'-O)-methyltransferase [Puniceicoccus vermicola]|uniref:Ribosomal RNA small subunit methyltransferase I n=1 Tax=Puniceicoccus vermicola TaxID=388746 RepID=A0A7X1AYM4_9BACT|nr:16S rRNA (cytidine(1402)-2'-O)-methyltransferase [Puniceicoccus vermicola]MBC2601333.1 16S rRNA (cytidine(1402)-2'-O)-methyltransferase [Puniceicoccus vermicola]
MVDSDSSATGTLYVVSTPIGNLGDLSPRAREVLSEVQIIACEDTRVTGSLLAHVGIERPKLVSYRNENETVRAQELVEDLLTGQTVAVVSDAGTPTISDPGFRLVRACQKAGIPISVVPGPCAIVAAIAASGLPSDRFYFCGFLPPKSAARRRFLEEHLDFPSTLVVYESVHRIEKFLDEIVDVLGEERILSVSRELTKKFETTATGRAADVRQSVLSRARKGEFVVLIAPKTFDL